MDVSALAMQISVVAFMIGSLAGVGLGVAPRDVLAPLMHGRFVLLTLAIGWVAGPALARLLLWAIPVDRPYATALLLLALAPCAPFAPAMMRIARGDAAYVAAFMVLTAVMTVVLMPVGVPLLVPGAAVSAWDLARPLVLFVLAPLLAGTAVRGLWPHAAARLEPVVAAITRIATVALLVLVGIIHGGGVLDAVGSHAILVQVVFVAVVTVVAHVAGAALSAPQRGVVTVGMSTRNIGAALAPLAAIEQDPRAVVMIAIAVPVTIAAAALTARVLSSRVPCAGLIPGC